MHNLSFSRPDPDGDVFSVTFGIYVQNERADGTVTLDSVKDPYDGLTASSFSLAAQLEAGVPLRHVGVVPGSSLSSIDKNNASAVEFMNEVVSSKE